MKLSKIQLTKNSYLSFCYWLLIIVLAWTSLSSLGKTLSVAIDQWQHPVLFWDSWEFVHRGGNDSTSLDWLLRQHNEHRITIAKTSTYLETEIFNVEPTKSALLQSFIVLVLCCITWLAICKKTISNKKTVALTGIAGIAIITNPWQANNLNWEFQTPWLTINLIVLIMTYTLSLEKKSIIFLTGYAVLPWLAIFSSGQGLAALIALTFCSWIKGKRYGIIASVSCCIAIYTYYIALNYIKPGGHPSLSFDIYFFARSLLGNKWQGLGIITIGGGVIGILYRKKISWKYLPTILMPGLFSILFSGMITLSRSGMGINTAHESRYVTHTLMLGLSTILTIAMIKNKNTFPNLSAIETLLVVCAITLSFPQTITRNGKTFTEAISSIKSDAKWQRNNFICAAKRYALSQQELLPLDECKRLYPTIDKPNKYFDGKYTVKPIGWHKKLTDLRLVLSPTNQDSLTYRINTINSIKNGYELKGWAYTKEPKQLLFIIATYSNGKRYYTPINGGHEAEGKTTNTKEMRPKILVNIPKKMNGFMLLEIAIASESSNVKLKINASLLDNND